MAQMKTPGRRGALKKSRRRLPLYCLAGTVLLLAGIWLAGRWLEPESLTDEQILAKTSWTDDEIIHTAVQRLEAKRRTEGRTEVYRRLQDEIRKLPPQRQETVRDTIVRESVTAGLREYRLLAADKQQDLIKRMTEQMARRRSEFAKGQTQSQGREGLASGDGEQRKERAAKALQQIMDQLTPDERRDLAPLAKEWVKIAETL